MELYPKIYVFFCPEDYGSTFLRNVGNDIQGLHISEDSNLHSHCYENYAATFPEELVTEVRIHIFFFSLALQPQFGPWPTSMKLSVSLRFSRS
jgi:hypothetical protein